MEKQPLTKLKFKEEFIYRIEKELANDQPFYNSVIDEYNDIAYVKNLWGDCPSISINEVMSILENLKFLGAERVYITAHEDHQSYVFEGVKLIKT